MLWTAAGRLSIRNILYHINLFTPRQSCGQDSWQMRMEEIPTTRGTHCADLAPRTSAFSICPCTGIFQVLACNRAGARMRSGNETTRTQGFSENMVAGSTQPGKPVFVAGTRPRVVVPTSAGTQPPPRQFVVANPLVANNSPSPQPVSSKGQ